jgi:DNA-binding SARP family transcriptional activator/TolB-like protein/Flp pilus assembly protein TadD
MVTFRAFGGALLANNSGALSGPASQRRRIALLAILAASDNGRASRAKVTGYLWPDVDDETARHRLGDALHALRKALGRDAILSVGGELHLNPQVVQTDLGEFQHALALGDRQRAVSLYRGAFLDGFYIPDAAEFERWVDGERERFAREFARALTSLAEESEREGEWGAAIEWWRRLASHDPYSSRVALRFMQACERSGDAATALQHARVHETLLREEIGVEPDAELTALVGRLRQSRSGGTTPTGNADAAIDAPPPGAAREPSAAAGEPGTAPLPPARPAAVDAARAPPAEPALPGPSLPPRWSRRWRRWGALAALALVIVLTGKVLHERREGQLVEAGPIRSLAVLPLENCTPDPTQPGRADPSQDYFADQLTVELITRLAQIPDIRVTSRISAMRYKTPCGSPRRPDSSLRQIADELGVEAILEGALVREGERLRVNVQLIRTATDEHLWARGLAYEHSITDVLILQEEIVRDIAGAIRLQLAHPGDDGRAVARKVDPHAYDLYLQARSYAMRPGFRAADLLWAERLYQRAIQLDPAFTAAHARLAHVHTLLHWYGHDRTPGRLAQAEAALETARRLDPDLPEVHMAAGRYHYFGRSDSEAALREFAAAERLLPGDAEVRIAIGYAQRRQGRFAEALRTLESVIPLDPRNANFFYNLGTSYEGLRRFPEAARAYEHAYTLAPDFHEALVSRGWLFFRWTGEFDSLRSALERVPADFENVVGSLPTRFHVAMLARDHDAALRAVRSLPRDVTDNMRSYLPRTLLHAFVYDASGDHDRGRLHYDSARVLLEAEARTRPADARVRSALSRAYAGLDRKSEAVREARRATELNPVSRDVLAGWVYVIELAGVYARVGEADAAIRELEPLVKVGRIRAHELRLDWRWDRLREHPGFRDLIALAQ